MMRLQRAMIITVVVAVIAIVSLSAVGMFRPAAAVQEDATLRSTVRSAIEAKLASYQLPAGFVVGKASESARAALKERLISRAETTFTGGFRTQYLGNVLPWLESVSSSYDQVFDLVVNVEQFSVSSVVQTADTATVTGTYTVKIKHAQAMGGESKLVTWGGRSSSDYTATMKKEGGVWRLADLATHQTDFIDDPADHGGGQYLPTPGDKTSGGDDPIPVLP